MKTYSVCIKLKGLDVFKLKMVTPKILIKKLIYVLYQYFRIFDVFPVSGYFLGFGKNVMQGKLIAIVYTLRTY